MHINEAAPAKATRERHIRATRDVVWTILTGIDEWPRWNPGVSRARLEGPIEPGVIFRWKSGGSSLVSTIREVERPARIVWTGKTLGIGAIHVWEITSVDDGVIVRTSESFDGWMVRLFRLPLQRLLGRTLDSMLHALKTVAEKSS